MHKRMRPLTRPRRPHGSPQFLAGSRRDRRPVGVPHSPAVANATGEDPDWAPAADFWRDRPVAVTGATGFLGGHLVGMLVGLASRVVILGRDQVRALPMAEAWRDRVTVVRGAVEDQVLVERMLGDYEVATAFHLAAQTQVEVASDNPASTFDANVRGTWSVLEAARRSPRLAQVVIASTDKVYGEQRALPSTEQSPLLAVHPIDVSKACADLVAASYARTFGLAVAISRCGTLFGPGDIDWRHLVPGTVLRLLEGRPPVVPAAGVARRDYLYVIDAALSYLRLAEALAERPELAGEAWNFSTERPRTVPDLVELLQIGVGTRLEPEVYQAADHRSDHLYPSAADYRSHDLYTSAAKARTLLGWRPHYTVEEAVITSVRWYRGFLGPS
jgi:CDP-glucose 4,6-dehydratase